MVSAILRSSYYTDDGYFSVRLVDFLLERVICMTCDNLVCKQISRKCEICKKLDTQEMKGTEKVWLQLLWEISVWWCISCPISQAGSVEEGSEPVPAVFSSHR